MAGQATRGLRCQMVAEPGNMGVLLRNSALQKMKEYEGAFIFLKCRRSTLCMQYTRTLEGKIKWSRMENWLEKSCLLLQISLQGIGNSNFNSHTFEGWWLLHYPWWNLQTTINMYFQAKNHHSLLLSDNLRQKSYLLLLECTAFSTAFISVAANSTLLWLVFRCCSFLNCHLAWDNQDKREFQGASTSRKGKKTLSVGKKLFLLAPSSLICYRWHWVWCWFNVCIRGIDFTVKSQTPAIV